MIGTKLGNRKKITGFHPVLVVAYLLFVAIAGFEKGLGGDNLGYAVMFDDVVKLNDFSFTDIDIGGRFQPLWLYFQSIAKTIEDDFTSLMILHAVVINASIFFFVRNKTSRVFSTLLLFFITLDYFYFNIEILRESLAISCFLLGLLFLEKKAKYKYIAYYGLAIIAFFFHAGAIFLFVFPIGYYLIERYRRSPKFILYFSLMAIGLANLGLFITYLTPVGALVNVVEQFQDYASHEMNTFNQLIMAIYRSSYVVILLYCGSKIGYKDNLIINCNIFLVLLMLCSPFIIGLYRLCNYLQIPFFILAADVFYLSRKTHYRQYVVIALSLMFVYYINFYSVSATFLGHDARLYQMYFPYRCIFD
jgi:hypothetical protein